MRSRRLLVGEGPILACAIARCGQITTPSQQSAPASIQQTSLPAVHIELTVDR
jgi:hypothetical protein